MTKEYENISGNPVSWYALTAHHHDISLGVQEGEVNCDICIIGAGFTGLSAALELAERGFSVVILESRTVASGASGKNGGHLQRGFAKSPQGMIDKFGLDQAKMINDLPLEGIALIRSRVEKYKIDCDLAFGHLTAARKPQHIQDLQDEIAGWKKLGQDDLTFLDQTATQDLAHTPQYIGGMYDPQGGHFHPLNYALGLAAACKSLGVRIYEQSKALRIAAAGTAYRVTTANGSVNSAFVLAAGALDMPDLPALQNRSMEVTAHMIATAPLSAEDRSRVMSRNLAVIDARFIMDYYRFSSDGRLLFGGNCNYSDHDFGTEAAWLKGRIVNLFPFLHHIAIDHCWHGPLDLTANRLPRVGRVGRGLYFAHGFGGHGVVATNILGKIMAEAIAGTARRFDVFAQIKHAPFIGGAVLKRPLFVLAMTWYKLRDLL